MANKISQNVESLIAGITEHQIVESRGRNQKPARPNCLLLDGGSDVNETGEPKIGLETEISTNSLQPIMRISKISLGATEFLQAILFTVTAVSRQPSGILRTLFT